ncbi:TonB-dependent receptor [Niveispirillum sp. BGYR6]|uniref:TonB-dependent receptor n=1 Tax=Niveispirillum sp. BGYR6 TaxID=2971249 RepID=UPI0022B97FD0|nr:TonB-dependent receptor [Niveispirillum sp. BGYR6]MDG5498077.1 TonB-dependent receptor [Niveispirillum sp. BGYR6]
MKRHNPPHSPRRWFAATISLLVAAAAPSSALADETADTPALEEIVVTGFRAANRAAVKAKQDSDVIIDAISQDDIGRLPDLNIVESARRIAGLSTVGGLDPTKNRDIYQRVTIRGLDPKYNLITLDGVPLASSEWTVRGARLEQFPNSLVSRIEAVKTLTAQYDPHGLGGQINIVSRSAFDARRTSALAVNASGGLNSTSGDFMNGRHPNLRADATGSTLFGRDDQFGAVVSAEYQKLWSSAFSELPGDTNGNGWTYYTASGAQTPYAAQSRDGILVPIRPQDFRFDNKRSRFSINGKLEWRPNDTDQFSLFAGYYKDKDDEFRAEVLTNPGGVPTGVTSSNGSFPLGDLQQGIVLQPQERETTLVTGKGSMALTDDIKLDMAASYSVAGYDEQRIFQKWAGKVTPGRVSTGTLPAFGYDYTLVNGAPRITHKNANLGSDPSAYSALYVRDVRRDSDSHIAFARTDLSYNADKDDQGFGARLGGSFTRTLQKFDGSYQELTPANTAAQTAIGGLGPVIFSDRFPSRDHSIMPYLVIDPDKVQKLVASNPSLWVATNRVADNFADDFHDLEDVSALYGQALFQSESLTLNAGLRYDKTDLKIDTWQVPPGAAAVDYRKFRRDAGYDYWLPSLLATWRFNEEMRLTGGISKTIGRPDFGQYAARTTTAVNPSGNLSVSTGNPDLKPREAVNYDISYEWYRGSGMISVAAFYKDISNEIFTGSNDVTNGTYQGVTYPLITYSQPLNAGKAHVQGLELGLVQDHFDFLPDWLSGLGVSANLTWLDGSFDLPTSSGAQAVGQPKVRATSGLIQQPDYILNTTLFYVVQDWEARLSVNHIGRALQQASQDTPERDLYQEPRLQLDIQFRYSFSDQLDMILQGQNITQEAFEVRQGPGRAYLNNLFPVGSTWWAGFSWKS